MRQGLIGKDGLVHGRGMARFAEKPLGRDPYDPARLSDRRLKKMICPYKKCAKCPDKCGYGEELLRRRAEKVGRKAD